jgi:adenylate cyclase
MNEKRQFKIPIGFKLVSIIALILVTSTLAVIYAATHLFSDDTKSLIYEMNKNSASQLSDQTKSYFERLTSALTTLVEIDSEQKDSRQRAYSFEEFYKSNNEVQALVTWQKNALVPAKKLFQAEPSPLVEFVTKLHPLAKAWDGGVDLERVIFNGQGFLAFSFPLTIDREKHVIVAAVGLVNQSKLIQIFGKKSVGISYLVDHDGNILAHPTEKLVLSGASLKETPIVRAMLESTVPNNVQPFTDRDGKAYLGAFRQVGVGGVGVIVQTLEETALAAVERVKYRSLLIAGIALFLGFSAIYFFSMTLTRPIKALVTLTREIAKGNFNIAVKPKGRDEIAELTKSFGQMATGLAERDKLKETFNKFHSKEIAEAILSGEIKLGGNRQQATVFFSDIRSFTSISEELEAEQVVEMLNEYMTAMVEEITAHHGVVDKYVGDAIMAIWGVPMSKPEDTWNAVRASLAMRMRLEKFNQERIQKGKKPICIGMGLHSGELIAGNIGSNQKMEYTVIGDTVNTASRVESLTKEFGTDMLISDSVYEKVKDKLIVEAVSASVKGKAKALKAYKVKGYYDETGKAIILETPYSTYESGHSDKVVHEKASA